MLLIALLPLALAARASATEPVGTVPRSAAGPPAPEQASAAGEGAAAAGPEILLTFDDGPRLDLTPRVLEVLDRRGIKAVFFVNGWRFQGHSPEANKARALLQDIMRRGHLVGNHTVHHLFLCGQRGPRIAEREIEDNAVLIEEATGMRPLLYRTPYGAHCPSLSATLRKLGIRSTGWDIDPQDWRLRDPDKILAYMQQRLRVLRRRAIVLFHDVQPATVAALPRLLDWIDEENAARRAAGRPEIRYIDYGYLLPEYPIVPPIVDGLGRILVDAVRRSPLPSLLPFSLRGHGRGDGSATISPM
ncbi:MAG: polysaccharide deacetylase family protein [Myxococcales bacterium]|nr:polysaccharide deacetylase family protein [Myxococcales bacterium]